MTDIEEAIHRVADKIGDLDNTFIGILSVLERRLEWDQAVAEQASKDDIQETP